MTVTGEVFSIEICKRGNYKVGGSMYRYSEVYPFGISWRTVSKVYCTNSYMIILIFMTVAHRYSFDSWQLQFWDIILISLKCIMYRFLHSFFNFYHCSSQLQF